LGYQVPKSPLGKIPDNLNQYAGGPNTVDTENSFLSMSPTGFYNLNLNFKKGAFNKSM